MENLLEKVDQMLEVIRFWQGLPLLILDQMRYDHTPDTRGFSL